MHSLWVCWCHPYIESTDSLTMISYTKQHNDMCPWKAIKDIELPQMEFEPTTTGFLDQHSTN